MKLERKEEQAESKTTEERSSVARPCSGGLADPAFIAVERQRRHIQYTIFNVCFRRRKVL